MTDLEKAIELTHTMETFLSNKIVALQAELTALKSELAEAEKVIEFYANHNGWGGFNMSGHISQHDRGEYAREWLAKRKGKE